MSDTKDYIVDEAYILFMNKSYEAVSINDISKAVGLTKGALYHHFSSKEEIFKAVIDKYFAVMSFHVNAEEKTFVDFMEDILAHAKNVAFSILGENPKFVPLSYFALAIDALRHYPGFANEKLQMMDDDIAKIKVIMDTAILKGEIRSNINTHIMAINFFSFATGMAASILQNNTPQKALELLRMQMYELYNIMKV